MMNDLDGILFFLALVCFLYLLGSVRRGEG